MNKNRQIFLSAMAVLGAIGWVMLVIPELHFIYKELMPVLGKGKYLAFILMGAAMFIVLPVYNAKTGWRYPASLSWQLA